MSTETETLTPTTVWHWPSAMTITEETVILTFLSEQAAREFSIQQDLDPKTTRIMPSGSKFLVTDFDEWFVIINIPQPGDDFDVHLIA